MRGPLLYIPKSRIDLKCVRSDADSTQGHLVHKLGHPSPPLVGRVEEDDTVLFSFLLMVVLGAVRDTSATSDGESAHDDPSSTSSTSSDTCSSPLLR